MRRQLFVVMVLWLLAAATASAHEGAVRTRDRLARAAARLKMPHYLKGNKVVLNPNREVHLRALQRILKKGSNVLEIMHVGTSDAQHTLVRFDELFLHMQVLGSHWRLRRLTDDDFKDPDLDGRDLLRTSTTPLYSAMIQLEPDEAARLRERLRLAVTEQGPESEAGQDWDRGHIKNAFNGNCAGVWCGTPLGANGQTLAQISGVANGGNPRGLQTELEQGGSDRVFGLAIYGPAIPGFGDQAPNLFTWSHRE
jgi:hypothetical protein